MRLLLVSYEFPPKGGTQAQHVAGLARGLAREGWEVEVVTVADPPTPLVDSAALAAVLADGVRVRTAYSLEPTRALQWLRRLRGSGSATPAAPGATSAASGAPAAAASGARGYTSLPRPVIRAIQALFVPDEKVGWSPYAIRVIGTANCERPFDAILSSGPPFTAHSIALRASRELSIPWVADVRDPIVGGYFFRPATSLNARLMRRFESRVVHGATHVVTATEWITGEVLRRFPELAGRIETLPNAFDPAAFSGPAPERDAAHFTIAYVGTFQATIRPHAFLDAIARLRDAGSPAFADLHARFVGPRDPDTDEAVTERGLGAVVERTGFVPQRAAFEAMRAADVLLLVLGPEPASAGILTSKLPEYLGAGRPVLALVADGIAADVVRRSGAGEIVQPRDPAAIAGAIERLHVAWRAGTLPAPRAAVVAEFDRDRIVASLSGILHSAVESRASGGDSRG